MEQFVNYLKQPSTYKGLAMLGAVFGLGVPATTIEIVCQSIVGVIGAWAVIRDEFKGAKKMVEQTK